MDFKFAHPSADITGLVRTIHAITDMVRINHGLRPKYEQQTASSGFAAMMEKLGVIEDNIRRSRIFKEREQQLFQVIKKLWNAHHNKSGDRRFSEDSTLDITYKVPEFTVDPKTKKEDLMMEAKLLDSEDVHIIGKLYPHMSEVEIKKLITKRRKDRQDKAEFETQLQISSNISLQESGLAAPGPSSKGEDLDVRKPKIDNRAKHSEESSKQPGKNMDKRAKSKKKDEV
jgi:hypothetical protein